MTLEDISIMVYGYRKQLKQNKIPCGVVESVEIAPKNAKYFGITQILPNGRYKIKISRIAIYAGEKSLKNTILHELLHTCRGCYNHGEKFKKYGEIVYNVFGEKITTYASREEMEAIKNYK